ncbi:MAG: hypothetical protein KJT03_19985 [Verrucomicrobiae bacterium]|nr:hypothetical protein [Verrucomicrobiae bacterium]
MKALLGIRYFSAVTLFLYVVAMVGLSVATLIKYDFNYFAKPTLGFVILSLGAAIWVFPRNSSRIQKGGKALFILALAFLGIGSVSDLFYRASLKESIENVGELRLRISEGYLNDNEKNLITSAIENEPLRINAMQTLTNFITGYNTCMCGPGDGFVDEKNRIVFTTKHGDELYINGFLSFTITTDPIDALQRQK